MGNILPVPAALEQASPAVQVLRHKARLHEHQRELAEKRARLLEKHDQHAAVLADLKKELEAAQAEEEAIELQLALYQEKAKAMNQAEPNSKHWRDWGNRFGEGGPRAMPTEVLAKVGEKLVAQDEAGWAAWLKELGWSEEEIQEEMAKRKSATGNCLFVFAMVCKEWRKAQLKVGGPLRTRVKSDVTMPGRVALAKWALGEGCPREEVNPVNGNLETLATDAAEFGHIELVQWLIGEQGFAMDEKVMQAAAFSGNLELVQWLRAKGCEWDEESCWTAAQGGRLLVLQWLRANGCPWNAETCEYAALGGHLATLRWARENGCDWNEDTCLNAAAGGHLEILQWLRVEGCPWDFNTCHHAVEQGSVEVLRWARENGCPWDAETRDWAAEKLGYTDDLGNLVA